MHGLGNDFIIIDERDKSGLPEGKAAIVAALSNRHTGIGCDQFIVLRHSATVACLMVIYNADGTLSGACGNATRCVAMYLYNAGVALPLTIETSAGLLQCDYSGQEVSVTMGIPHCDWQDIPLRSEMNTLYMPHDLPLQDGVAVNIGNPHLVIFVDKADDPALMDYGKQLETAAIFPEKANINFAHVVNASEIILRTWERGVGATQACGSGACATMVAARRRALVSEETIIHMRGGDVRIYWQGTEDDQQHPVIMSGGASYVFTGTLPQGVWE